MGKMNHLFLFSLIPHLHEEFPYYPVTKVEWNNLLNKEVCGNLVY